VNFRFYGDVHELKKGIGILSGNLGFKISHDGFPVKVENRPGNIEVRIDEKEGYIGFNEKIHFFRGLGTFIEAARQKEKFCIVEDPQFTMNGIMIDASRNAVMRVNSLKKTIEIMALMGLNMLMLYTEDTYTIENRPYFGYMRGRYIYDELKECDDYAYIFGIEIIPCIQTLAHLAAALKWSAMAELRDTEDILLVGSEKTYEFIEEMIKSALAPFRSKRIHLGMDEALYLGLGKYLSLNGYRRRFDIMNEHLIRVKEIADKYNLKTMIWSDMFFRLASKTGDYYDMDAEVPEDAIKKVPDGMQLVYWDYYHNKQETYKTFIEKHQKFGCGIVFAGGIRTWNGVNIEYQKTFTITNAALAACKNVGVKEVFATLWGDNGSETNFFTGLLGMQLYAEHGYTKELDMDKLKRRFKFCTGGDYEAFINLSLFNNVPGIDPDAFVPPNPSKFLLWQDLLIGLFDKDAEEYDFPQHFSMVAKKLEKDIENSGEWRFLFEQAAKLASVLSIKSHLGLKIKEYYDKKDKEALNRIIETDLVKLAESVSELRTLHRQQWFKTYKPFGWEVLDLRYGGLLSRIDSTSDRLKNYINGTVDVIEELEEERLYFDEVAREKGEGIGRCNLYHRIVTAGTLGFSG
jgi:hexosaminidase